MARFLLCVVVIAMLACGTRGQVRPSCACPRMLKEVCGSDGKSYGNECMANCNGATVQAQGKCRPTCACPRLLDPVCVGGTKQFANECLAKCSQQNPKGVTAALAIKRGPC